MQYPKAKAFQDISSIVDHLLLLKQKQVTKRICLVVIKVKDHFLYTKVLFNKSDKSSVKVKMVELAARVRVLMSSG